MAGSVALPVTRLGVIGAVGLCTTYVVAYVCWYLALGLVRPVRLAALFNIEPLVTLFVAWLVLGERLSALQLTGAALVLASILSMSLSTPSDDGRRSASVLSQSSAFSTRLAGSAFLQISPQCGQY